MEIKNLFDHKRMNRNLLTGWGSSYLINDTILFDTGERWGCLQTNMDSMGIRLEDIETVVISHEHFDHVGGLWGVLRERSGIDLYICHGFSREFKENARAYKGNICEVDSFREIADGIYITGQIEGGNRNFDSVPEQALVLRTDKGLTVLTGCAHPGIADIVKCVADRFKDRIHMIVGGFHLLDEPVGRIMGINDRIKDMGVEYVAPGHCTGDDACRIFKDSYKDHYIPIKVGQTIRV